jgi:hypothetical protein
MAERCQFKYLLKLLCMHGLRSPAPTWTAPKRTSAPSISSRKRLRDRPQRRERGAPREKLAMFLDVASP